MNKPIIAVDIDDVLSRTAEGILAYSNARWGHANTLDDFSEHVAQMWQVDEAEAERRWLEFMASDSMERYEVIAGAKEALEQIGRDYKLIELTSRRATLLDMTNRWIESNYAGIFKSVHSARIYGEGHQDPHALTKAEMLGELNAKYLIDDQPKHCIGASEAGVTAVVFGDYPWNKQLKLAQNMVRCKDWVAVAEYFAARHG